MFKRKAILSVVILAAVLFLIHTATLSSTDLELNVPQSDPNFTPDWDHFGLKDCGGDCFDQAAGGFWSFDVCYACYCLKTAARTGGERASADAQCLAALRG